jgi:hypothetical protein
MIHRREPPRPSAQPAGPRPLGAVSDSLERELTSDEQPVPQRPAVKYIGWGMWLASAMGLGVTALGWLPPLPGFFGSVALFIVGGAVLSHHWQGQQRRTRVSLLSEHGFHAADELGPDTEPYVKAAVALTRRALVRIWPSSWSCEWHAVHKKQDPEIALLGCSFWHFFSGKRKTTYWGVVAAPCGYNTGRPIALVSPRSEVQRREFGGHVTRLSSGWSMISEAAAAGRLCLGAEAIVQRFVLSEAWRKGEVRLPRIFIGDGVVCIAFLAAWRPPEDILRWPEMMHNIEGEVQRLSQEHLVQ